MRPVHHRMPVILPPEGDWQFWLDFLRGKAESLQEIMRPLPADQLQSWAVDRHVNRPGI